MPSTTPNRNYPFPLNPDRINVAGDIESLARAVDGDVQNVAVAHNQDIGTLTTWIHDETAARIVGDNNVIAQTQVHAWIGHGDGTGEDYAATKLLFKASLVVVALDGFGHAVIPFFPVTFAHAPIVVANIASANAVAQVGTTGMGDGGAPSVTTTEFHVIARAPDGSNIPDAVLSFNYIAIGFMT